MNKLLFSINFLGLVCGLTISFAMVLYLAHELSYDSFHVNKDKIFRINTWNKVFDIKTPLTNYRVSPLIKDNLADIVYATRLGSRKVQIQSKDKLFSERFTFCDRDIFKIFSVEFVESIDGFQNLDENKVVLSQSLADKLFSNRNVMGKTLTLKYNGRTKDVKVSGIIKDFPTNSSIKLNSLLFFGNNPEVLSRKIGENPSDDNYQHFVQVKQTSDVTSLERSMNDFLKNFISEDAELEFKLQKLNDIYLGSSDLTNNMTLEGDLKNLYTMLTISSLVLIIVIINYIVLSSALYSKRSKEVGIRKAFGASKTEIIFQILFETVLTSIVAFMLSIVIFKFSYLHIQEFTSKSISYSILTYIPIFIIYFLIVILIGVLSGSYLAFVMSSYKPSSILSGDNTLNPKSKYFFRFLIGFQLIIFCGISSYLIFVQKQLNHVLQVDLGFDKNRLMVVYRPEFIRNMEKLQSIKNEIEKLPGIISASGIAYSPPYNSRIEDIITDAEDPENKVRIEVMNGDSDLIETFQFKLVEGQSFKDRGSKTNAKHAILNELAVKQLSMVNPIGKLIKNQHNEFEIIGVVQDFHMHNFYTDIMPMVITNDLFIKDFAIRISDTNPSLSMNLVYNKFRQLYPEEIIEINFFDDLLGEHYTKEIELKNILSSFTLIAILLMSISLIGFSLYSSSCRTKEISIRKVYGATKEKVISLLLKEYVLIILISNLLSIPITVLFLNKWLGEFSYKIQLDAYGFLLTFFSSTSIVLGFVIININKIASLNPVKALKYN